MAKAAQKRAMPMPEDKSAIAKLFAFAMGPGLALAVLVVLGAHLIINDQADRAEVYAAHHPAR